MFNRWRSELRRQGFDASEEHGWDLRKVQLGDGDLADYFTKVAHEVTGAPRKEGRRAGGRTPMQLLADAVDTYELGDLARWWEWEEASEGRRQLTWSTSHRDLRALAGLAVEASDEDIAGADAAGDTVLHLASNIWRHVQDAGLEAHVLRLAETCGVDALHAVDLLAAVTRTHDRPSASPGNA